MSKIRIALATSDGKIIDQHFGKCQKFTIVDYDSDSKKYEVADIREAERMCSPTGHTQQGLEKTIKLLSDSKYVVVSRIGIWITPILKENAITAVEFSGNIEEALANIQKGL
ncbi:NifB/NifX family molybdenum-iron cluster-binding protein [Endomicrobium proavitum]|uniref:Dinitrogenase iron-molybdenum cofactor biosynthesis protein n=1 Tax=Endomicrobium proavitum TaxID=1408281 RepID=A0A0G3WHG7_9BACT|nr:NifB/NifX family molybdenum-iron cluster-binding protein [Endomicrobium proavitum]AKL98071.1 dinitrogenase iron-molybdenum cofactor biosynthesis protein [Endomicrobium proavitum]